uniref:Uncharacterized protein n=1 Tax=Anguilla anguilla TaxID=7936 RepID=A0A0E9QVY0_ANGAN
MGHKLQAVHCMQQICDKALSMTALIYITLICLKYYYALKWGGGHV